MKIRLTLNGTAPLIQHSIRLADDLDPIVRALKQVSRKRTKTDEDRFEMARLEFAGGLYFDPEVGPYLPGANVEKALVEGARITKSGKKIERGLLVTDNVVPLLYRGPRTVDALWADESFVHRAAVRVSMARVMRTRPIFRSWAVEAEAMLDESVLNLDELQSIADDAGSMVGLGDYRPRYGRFEVRVEAL